MVHYTDNNVEYRDYYRYLGIKFYFVSRGKAHEFSLKNTMLQVASGLGFMQLMTVITDFIMLNFYPKKRREQYRHFKVVDSVNFTDKMHRIDIVRYMRNQEREKVRKEFEEEEKKRLEAGEQEDS